MDRVWVVVILGILLGLLFAAAYVAFCFFLRSFTRIRRRIRLAGIRHTAASTPPPPLLCAICGVRSAQGEVQAERKQLLQSAGIRLDPMWYICLKRIVLLGCGVSCLLLWVYREALAGLIPAHPIVWLSVTAGLMVCIGCDRYFLESMKRYRTNRIVEEIFSVSRQLLYFSGSPLHLHGKLGRCLPYTKLIRQEWHLLLNDWYQDAEGAISRFRSRLSTEEAYGFAETLQYLRLYDDEAYYSLLRQRVQDYKEKLEIIRDSRKESASYVLFVLAALPIMYTFQIFMYPWVQEGQRLFQSLN
ncbi:MAG: hypothetical protein K0R57_5564 [Paenibacillaceae bacterium]|jgi:hypothetical protein|nr:hypothetical protein [Paenibacillaceae bacterium]